MAKDKTTYTCNACGGTSPRWLGKCPSCGAWNTLVETVADSASGGKNRLSQPQGYAGLANAQPVTRCRPSRPRMWGVRPAASRSWTACWAAAWSKAAWC